MLTTVSVMIDSMFIWKRIFDDPRERPAPGADIDWLPDRPAAIGSPEPGHA